MTTTTRPVLRDPDAPTLGESLVVAARETDPVARLVFVALVAALPVLSVALAVLAPTLR